MNDTIKTWLWRTYVTIWACSMLYFFREAILAIIILLLILAIPFGLLTNLITPSYTRQQWKNTNDDY